MSDPSDQMIDDHEREDQFRIRDEQIAAQGDVTDEQIAEALAAAPCCCRTDYESLSPPKADVSDAAIDAAVPTLYPLVMRREAVRKILDAQAAAHAASLVVESEQRRDAAERAALEGDTE